jgi:hypothetical protein
MGRQKEFDPFLVECKKCATKIVTTSLSRPVCKTCRRRLSDGQFKWLRPATAAEYAAFRKEKDDALIRYNKQRKGTPK